MEEYILNIRHTKHSDLEANQSFKNAVGRSRECDKYSEVADNLSYVSGQSDEKFQMSKNTQMILDRKL